MRDNLGIYQILLMSHRWLAWIALAAAIAAIGTLSPRHRDGPGRARPIWTWTFQASLAAQALIGLLLYLRFSPFTAGVRANLDVVLDDPTLRYWNAVHPLVGMLAVGAMIGGPIYARRADTAEAANRRARWALVLAAALSAAAIPWTA